MIVPDFDRDPERAGGEADEEQGRERIGKGAQTRLPTLIHPREQERDARMRVVERRREHRRRSEQQDAGLDNFECAEQRHADVSPDDGQRFDEHRKQQACRADEKERAALGGGRALRFEF